MTATDNFFAETQREHAGHTASGPSVVFMDARTAGCSRFHAEDFAGDDGQTPPHDLEAEVAVLGSVLLLSTSPVDRAAENAETLRRVHGLLQPGDFYRSAHADIYRVQNELYEANRAVDIMLLREELQRRGILERIGGTPLLSRLVASVPTSANAQYYAMIVRQCAQRRALAGAAALVRREALAGRAEQLDAAVEELRRIRVEDVDDAARAAGFAGRVGSADRLLLDDTVDDEQDWIVGDGILPRGGVSFLTAPLKSGKTIAALGLAVDLAARLVVPDLCATFLGSPVEGAGRVLYLGAEGGLALLKKRIGRIAAGMGAHAVAGLLYYAEKPRPDLCSDRDVRAAYRFARDQGCIAVIWDPFGRFWRPENEDDPKFARDVMDRLEDESGDAEVGTVLLHHDTKNHSDEKLSVNAGRGSGRLGDDASGAIINLRRVAKKGEPADTCMIEASFLVRDGEQLPRRRFRIDRETMRLVGAETSRQAPREPAGAAVPTVSDGSLLRALQDLGGAELNWTPVKRVAAAVGLARNTMNDRLDRLISAGRVERREAKNQSFEYRVRVSDASVDARPTACGA
jgi:hypothetical protein